MCHWAGVESLCRCSCTLECADKSLIRWQEILQRKGKDRFVWLQGKITDQKIEANEWHNQGQLPNNYQTTTKRILLCSFFRSLGDVSSDLQVCANSEEKFIGHVRTHFVSLVWRILKVRTVWICSWCICNMSYGAVSGRFGTAEELQQSNLLSCGPNMWAMER